MGSGVWSNTEYAATASVRQTQTREQVFTKRKIARDFDPKHIEMRESCDSEDSPESTAVIVGLDVTGSMGFIAEHIANKSLGTLVEGILKTRPVSDPHIMMMAIGDINYDDAPLQVSQFEADNRISDQLVDLWLEGGGGGNSYESYDLPWAFAANKTKIDCFDKRGKKGYLFTIGDELPPTVASSKVINETCNIQVQDKTTGVELLATAQERYDVFHVIVEEGYYCSHSVEPVKKAWNNLMGKHAILLDNHKYISEVILSVMRVNEGADAQEVVDSWQDQDAQDTVRHALFS